MGGVHRLAAGCVAVQRHENLPVREPRSKFMSRMYRESSLADPGHPSYRMDTHHSVDIDLSQQLSELGFASSEGGDIVRQRLDRRCRTRCCYGRRPRCGKPHPPASCRLELGSVLIAEL